MPHQSQYSSGVIPNSCLSGRQVIRNLFSFNKILKQVQHDYLHIILRFDISFCKVL